MSMYAILELLDSAQVDYVLIGGLAVTLRGYQRLTMDVDVALSMSPENLHRFIAAARRGGLQPVMPVPIDSLADPELMNRWHDEKGMLAFALRHPERQSTVIDVLIRPKVSFDELKAHSDALPIGSLRVPTASIEDLIRLKTGTGRTKDAVDIDELRKLPGRSEAT